MVAKTRNSAALPTGISWHFFGKLGAEQKIPGIGIRNSLQSYCHCKDESNFDDQKGVNGKRPKWFLTPAPLFIWDFFISLLSAHGGVFRVKFCHELERCQQSFTLSHILSPTGEARPPGSTVLAFRKLDFCSYKRPRQRWSPAAPAKEACAMALTPQPPKELFAPGPCLLCIHLLCSLLLSARGGWMCWPGRLLLCHP